MLTCRPAALSCTRCPWRPSGVCSCCFGSSASLAPCALVWYTSSVPGGAFSCQPVWLTTIESVHRSA